MVDFLQEHPQYRLHLTVDNTGKLLHMMEEGKIDLDRKSTRLNSSHSGEARMPSSA